MAARVEVATLAPAGNEISPLSAACSAGASSPSIVSSPRRALQPQGELDGRERFPTNENESWTQELS